MSITADDGNAQEHPDDEQKKAGDTSEVGGNGVGDNNAAKVDDAPHDGNGVGKYQLFPDPSPEEDKVLEESMRQHGVLVPGIKDELGSIIEGHRRDRLAKKLGIHCPFLTKKFKSEQEKYQLALEANQARRRHLNGGQKREVIAKYLKGDPEISDNWLAEILGVSYGTVSEVREGLEATSQIGKLEQHRGKDGKKRPAKRKGKAKAGKAAKQKDKKSADQPGGKQVPDEGPATLPIPGTFDAVAGITPEELAALQTFVTAVGGWERAKSVVEEGYRQWQQNHEG
jgi:ParB-like chromosome segregation protein Spo0J